VGAFDGEQVQRRHTKAAGEGDEFVHGQRCAFADFELDDAAACPVGAALLHLTGQFSTGYAACGS
jgi:hypothetical protein